MRTREDIRAICKDSGVEKVQKYINGTAFGKREKGWAKERLDDQECAERREIRESKALQLAGESNEIADRATRISWIAAVASMVSAFIALVAVLTS